MNTARGTQASPCGYAGDLDDGAGNGGDRAAFDWALVLGAHKAHVSRQTQWLGGELKRLYGADYLNMALTFSAGSFNAIEQLPSGAFGQLRAHHRWHPSGLRTPFR